MDLKEYIRSIPDYPKKGILFRDITTLIKNEKAFTETINQIVERSKNFKFNKIAAIESRGFVFASAVSYLLKKPFILLRKKNKLPAERYSVDFELEYGTATIEMHILVIIFVESWVRGPLRVAFVSTCSSLAPNFIPNRSVKSYLVTR